MDTKEQTLVQNLRAHVELLAGGIGERNVFRPHLKAAAEYIERQWEQQYVVERLGYEAPGVNCLNLEITRARAQK